MFKGAITLKTMKLRIWNTLGRHITEVAPSNTDGVLRVYNCGPTVYATPHIGNIRRFVVADLLVKTLRNLDYDVRSAMNITDVGHLMDSDHTEAGADKMEIAAQRENLAPEVIAAKYTQEFFAILTQMRLAPADYYPRATLHIPAIIKVVTKLQENGFAYETASGVYFDVAKFGDYGKLSGNKTAEIEAGARIGVREEKKNPFDFALWIKSGKEHLMQWDSPWGRGYPGWHIECSAMAQQLLGETIDIHTGGIDNMFPHHENEIAQSEASTGKEFSKTWVHNEHLLVDGKKMSKSAGTFITLDEIIKRGFSPMSLKFLFLQTHYRSKLNFTWDALNAAGDGLNGVQNFIGKISAGINKENSNADQKLELKQLQERFTQSLSDDLGTPQALAIVFELIRAINPLLEAGKLSQNNYREILALLRAFDVVLGIFNFDAKNEATIIPDDVLALLAKREQARAEKNFSLSDELRKSISEKGYEVKDTATGQQLTPAK